MADEEPTPEESPGTQAPDTTAGPEATETAAGPRPKALWLTVLALIGLVVGLGEAGLLLRDQLERRQPPLAEAPSVIGEAEGDAVPMSSAGTRFGPEVKEVVVAAADTQPPPAPEPAPPAEPPEPAAVAKPPAPEEAPTPAPTPEAPPAAAPAPATVAGATPAPPPGSAATAPAATGSHALQVGIFGSQKYRAAMERQLEEAGLPHLRRQRNKTGEGYRLALTLSGATQRDKAQGILDAAGVLYNLQGDSLEAFFHFEAEAQRALQQLSEAGLNGGYGKVQGELPLWVVYAGPFTLEEAKRVRQQLAIQGLPSYLRNGP